MDRKEFCDILRQKRKESGVKLIDICIAMNKTAPEIARIELAKANFNMKLCYEYLNAIGYCIKIVENASESIICGYDELRGFVLEKLDGTYRSRDEKTHIIGRTRSVLLNIRNGRASITIDVLTNLFSYFGINIDVVKK